MSSVRLLVSKGHGISERFAGAATDALKKVGVNVHLIEVGSGASVEPKGKFLAAPLLLEHQKALVRDLRLHSKVIDTGATQSRKSGLYAGVQVRVVQNLLNYAANGNLQELRLQIPVSDEINQRLLRELEESFSNSAEIAVKLASQTAGETKIRVVRKVDKGLGQLLFEAAEKHVKAKNISGMSVQNIEPTKAINTVLVNPESIQVLLSPPEWYSADVSDIVVGIGGGNRLVPIVLRGVDASVFTASHTTEESGNPVGLLLSAHNLLVEENNKDAAKKLLESIKLE